MKFLDLFAGIGGFRMGLESLGHECVGFCEIDKFARKSYKAIYNTEGEVELHDITKVPDEEWRKFRGTVDIICGGFPCQAFSIAGKRKGFLDETRGTLFFEIARAVKEIKPPLLFLENVKGLLSHDQGRTFRTILSTLDELGYDAEWQILNSKDFGVPQNRERVFIIGHLRGERTRQVFPIVRKNGQTTGSNEIKVIGNTSDTGYRSHDVLDSTGISTTLMSRDYKGPKQVAVKQVGNISDSDSFGGNPKTGRAYGIDGIAPTLNTMQGGGREPKVMVIDDQGRKNKKISPKNIVPTLRAQSHGNEPKVATPVLTPNRVKKRQNGRRFKTDREPMFTLTAQDRHGVAVLRPVRTKYGKEIRKAYENGEVEESRHNMAKLEPRQDGISNTITTVQKDNLLKDGFRIRKLTPRECWRLQGFPDWAFDKAQEVNSNSQLYKQAGNSVTVNVIKAIAERL